MSICFDLCDIIKRDSIKNCSQEMMMNKNLGEIDGLLWNETDFKQLVTLRNSVRIIYLKEMKIFVFYRDFKKCFLVFYVAMNYYPQISLQRKSEIHFNITKAENFSYFLEDGFSYPKIHLKTKQLSFLHSVKIKDLEGVDCLNYFNESCLLQDDCQQMCVLENYAKKENSLPIKINIKSDDFLRFSSLKFNNNQESFDQIKKKCISEIYKESCENVKTSFRPKYNPSEPYNLSINLTPTLYLENTPNDENKLIVLNRILSVVLILSGFSIKTVIKKLLITFFSSRMSLTNYQILKRFSFFVILVMFLIYFRLLCYYLMYAPMEHSSSRPHSSHVSKKIC